MDKWTKREQLCLASAVSCSGDQNWITVSRTLKSVCGTESRPSDWYSQKNCAVQYGHLLESVESTKRKKRESGVGISSPLPVEPPTELLLKRLTEERLTDIKAQIRNDQEEYAALCREIKAIQSGKLNNEEVLEMWRQIESQQETQRIDEMKMENRMREREQRKQEMIGSWQRTSAKRVGSKTDTTTVDMDVEENTAESKSTTTAQQPQPATSPLLSSLLKSPTAGSNISNINNSNSASGSTVRVTAPTITTLLTSGNIPNQPAITIRSNVPASETAFITRPISGPPAPEIQSPTINTGKSPSQAAPTLSMLLEKNKITNTPINTQTSVTPTPKVAEVDTNNEQVPMDIEESTSITTKVTTVPNESDETDPNEEQQLLEVFKNIGNIDDIDIDMVGVIDDEEVDFLEDVATLPNESKPNIDFEDKLDELKNHETPIADEDGIKKPEEVKSPTVENPSAAEKNEMKPVENLKTEMVGSSDDSNDNIPLAEVASLESKERSQSATDLTYDKAEKEEQSEVKEAPVENMSNSETLKERQTKISYSNEESKPMTVCDEIGASAIKDGVSEDKIEIDSEKKDSQNIKNEIDKSDEISAADDDIVDKPVPSKVETEVKVTDSKSKMAEHASESNLGSENEKDKSSEEPKEFTLDTKTDTEKLLNTCSKTTTLSGITSQQTVILIGDTDEDSSMTDASKDEAASNKSTVVSTATPQRNQKPIVEESKSESDIAALQTTSAPTPATSVAPARPQALRKLVDRSESPMVEDDTTTTSDHSTKPSSRRRYSSTPVIDSIPNSPASSEYADDRRETRGASKKMFQNIYNSLYESRHATIFRRCFHDEHGQKFADLCSRPMDLPTIKRNIDSGGIRNVAELHRDVLLMCQNVLILYRSQTSQHKNALAFMQDCHNIKEFTTHTSHPDNRHVNSSHNTSTSKARSGSRKSQRHI